MSADEERHAVMTFDEYLATRLTALLRYATVVTADPYLAEDVVQEVLLRSQQRWPRIAATDQAEAYLKRMVLNEFLSLRRRMSRRAVPMSDSALERASAPVADPAARLADRDALIDMIATLPPKQRAVLALRYFEGHTDAEIADLLGCREVTVRSHASRALAALRPASNGAVTPGPTKNDTTTPCPAPNAATGEAS